MVQHLYARHQSLKRKKDILCEDIATPITKVQQSISDKCISLEMQITQGSAATDPMPSLLLLSVHEVLEYCDLKKDNVQSTEDCRKPIFKAGGQVI